jgi:hypothetical protein
MRKRHTTPAPILKTVGVKAVAIVRKLVVQLPVAIERAKQE